MSDSIFFAPDIRQHPFLTEDESQHCVKVLRMKEGEQIVVTDGKGFFYDCTLLQAHPKRCAVGIDRVTQIDKTRNEHIHIAFAPVKNMDRNEWFAEKATEIGVDEITLLQCRFSERKEMKTDRLNKIIVSAMKQSQQAYLPKLNPMIDFGHFVRSSFEGQKFVAHCYQTPKTLLAKAYRPNEDVLILIGPEGDFSEEEVHLAMDGGFLPVSLGENRLRTETACLAAVHTIYVIDQINPSNHLQNSTNPILK